MASLEQPPRYNETFSEFEVPSYGTSLQQLQSLPPPINDEPSLLDAPPQQANSYGGYELHTSNSGLVVNNSDLTPPPYEQSLGEEPCVDTIQSQVHVNTSLMGQTGQSFNGYPSGEVDDKIKDILSRYNPIGDKLEDSFPTPPQNQPIRQAQPLPRQAQQAPQAPQLHTQNVYQVPQQNNQYQQPQQQMHQTYQQPDQQQLRARVVQNVPSQIQSPPPQKYQQQQQQPIQQTQQSPVQSPLLHQQSPQLHRQAPQVHQQSVPQHSMPQQQMPQQQVPQHSVPQHSIPQQQHVPQQNIPQQHAPQMYQQPVQYQQPVVQHQQPVQQPQAQIQTPQSDSSYLQLLQQQAIQFQMQNQQIQQLQTYFDKISSFMEKTEKRLINLESTAQGILKNQKGDDLGNLVNQNELEVLKRMQHQMESDFDIAKRMQAEFEKEKKKEEKRRSKSNSSSSSPSTSSRSSKDKRDSKVSSSSSSMQECPICTIRVPFAELELHVNQCLEGIEKSDTKPDPAVQEKASFWKRVFGPGPKKDKEEPNNQIVPVTKPPPRPSVSTSSIGQPPMYPNSDFYQMPFVYRGGSYPQPQMVPYGYPQQQIYYYPPNMAQPNQGGKK